MANAALQPTATDLPENMVEALRLAGLSHKNLRSVRNGQTSRVWVHERAGFSSVIVKHADPRQGTPLFPNEPQSEWTAMASLSSRGLCAFPLVQQKLPNGTFLLVSQFIPTGAEVSAKAVASLMRRIHAIPPWASLPTQSKNAEILRRDGFAMLADSDPPAWLLRLSPPDTELQPELEPTLVHRDLVPANVVMTDATTAVALDWQCPALGDPCEDIAHATSPGMQSLSKTEPALCSGDLLEAYANASLAKAFTRWAPYYRWRMACYCQWQISRGKSAYARALEAECDALENARKRADHTG